MRDIPSKALAFVKSDLGRNTAWISLQSIFERGIGVVQTIILARILGITGYGIYGLLFGTIGFAASVMGLQLGLTATVHVARHRATDKTRVASIITGINRLVWCLALLLVLGTAPFTGQISEFLFKSADYRLVVFLGAAFTGLTVISSVQGGIAQGFEVFRALAKIRMLTALISLALVVPAAWSYGLSGIVTALLAGSMLRYVALHWVVRVQRTECAIPRRGPGHVVWPLIGNFALPSVVVSTLVGYATWYGTWLLSRQHAGFDAVAIVNTGLQWRSPMMLLIAALGSAAIPAFSRHISLGEHARVRQMRHTLIAFNGSIAAAASLALIAVSGFILGLYGAGFERGQLAFALVLLSTIPSAIAGVYMQELISSARMWRQLWLHGPYVATLLMAFYGWVPRHGADGYGAAVLVAGLVFLLTAIGGDAYTRRTMRTEASTGDCAP